MVSARYPAIFAVVVTLMNYPSWYVPYESIAMSLGRATANATFWFLLAYGVVWVIEKIRNR